MIRRNLIALVAIAISGSLADAQSLDGRLKTIHDTGTLRIAHRSDSRPFSFLDAQGYPAGYTIDLCRRVAESLRRDLGLPSLAITWVRVDARTRFSVLANGEADMECGSTTISLSRMRRVDFSNLIFVESTGVLVREAGLRRFEDLAGRKIGVVPGSTNERAIKEQLERRRMSANLVQFRDREEGVRALASGALDGFASDKLVLLSMAQAIDRRDLSLLPEDLSFEPFAIMLPQGDWALRLAVNAGLARVYRSGEIVEIYNKWFSALSQRPSVWVGAVYAFGALAD